MSHAHTKKKKLASKIDEKNCKNKKKGRKSTAGFDQTSTPFHEDILPLQYNAQENELERVGRSKRRTEW